MYAPMPFIRSGGHDIFADWDLKVDSLLSFLVNKSLTSLSWTWYFRDFVQIREIHENIMSAKISCPTVVGLMC